MRRRRDREIPRGRIAITARDKAILQSVFTYRYLRTPHIIMLGSGGKAIDQLAANVRGTILAGPATLADEVFWKVECESGTGWVAAADLVHIEQEREQRLSAQTPLGATVQTSQKTLVRNRPGGGERRVKARLTELFHHRLLMRIGEPRIDYDKPGLDPLIYALNNAGADVLNEMHGFTRGTIDWQAKNKEITSASQIYHTLAIAEIMVKCIADCRERGNTACLQQWEVIQGTPHARQPNTDRYSWSVRARLRVRDAKTKQLTERELPLGVRPDRFFGINLHTQEGQVRRIRCFLEADLSTIQVQWRGLRKSSIAKKIIGYGETYKQKKHEDMFRWGRFRVLFVTTSQARIDTMLAHVMKVSAERGYREDLFWFTDYTTISEQSVFEVPWRLIRGGKEVRQTLLE